MKFQNCFQFFVRKLIVFVKSFITSTPDFVELFFSNHFVTSCLTSYQCFFFLSLNLCCFILFSSFGHLSVFVPSACFFFIFMFLQFFSELMLFLFVILLLLFLLLSFSFFADEEKLCYCSLFLSSFEKNYIDLHIFAEDCVTLTFRSSPPPSLSFLLTQILP